MTNISFVINDHKGYRKWVLHATPTKMYDVKDIVYKHSKRTKMIHIEIIIRYIMMDLSLGEV